MLYIAEITIPPQTPKEDYVTTSLTIEGERVERYQVLIPPGHCGLTGLAIFYGIEQLAPLPSGTWIRGDSETIEWSEYWNIPGRKCELILHAYNEDDSYEHTFIVRVHVIETWEARFRGWPEEWWGGEES